MATIDKNVFQKAFRASTKPIRMMPDFIIIGTQKGGTTSLYRYLIEHPCIAPIYIKEPHFFDIYFYKGLQWYRAHFPTTVGKYYARHIQKHDLITGEASPYYLFHPQAARRVAKTLPKARLIVLLRNPIDRAYSQYQHQTRQRGVEPLTFEEALECEEKRLAGEEEKLLKDDKYCSFNHRHYSYLARSKYIEQLPTWMSIFPKEQFLIHGGMRRGTDAVYSYLAENTKIGPGYRKEVDVFDVYLAEDLQWDRAHFPSYIHKYQAEGLQNHSVNPGQASPYRLSHPHA